MILSKILSYQCKSTLCLGEGGTQISDVVHTDMGLQLYLWFLPEKESPEHHVTYYIQG